MVLIGSAMVGWFIYNQMHVKKLADDPKKDKEQVMTSSLPRQSFDDVPPTIDNTPKNSVVPPLQTTQESQQQVARQTLNNQKKELSPEEKIMRARLGCPSTVSILRNRLRLRKNRSAGQVRTIQKPAQTARHWRAE